MQRQPDDFNNLYWNLSWTSTTGQNDNPDPPYNESFFSQALDDTETILTTLPKHDYIDNDQNGTQSLGFFLTPISGLDRQRLTLNLE